MCVTFKEAHLSSTKIVVGDAVIGGEQLRYTWYDNVAEPVNKFTRRTALLGGDASPPASLPTSWSFPEPTEKPKGALDLSRFDNCLAFPIFGEFDSIAVIDTAGMPNSLDDIARAVHTQYDNADAVSFGSAKRMMLLGGDDGPVRVVVTGFYTSILAMSARDIIKTLAENRARPDLAPPAIVEKLNRANPGVPFGLHLFRTAAANRGALLLTYKPLPLYASLYHFPTLDGHGELDFNEHVMTDHMLAVGTKDVKGIPVHYQRLPAANAPETIGKCLPERVLGIELKMPLANGDVVVSVAHAKRGIWEARRVAPFGLSADESPLVTSPIALPAPKSF